MKHLFILLTAFALLASCNQALIFNDHAFAYEQAGKPAFPDFIDLVKDNSVRFCSDDECRLPVFFVKSISLDDEQLAVRYWKEGLTTQYYPDNLVETYNANMASGGDYLLFKYCKKQVLLNHYSDCDSASHQYVKQYKRYPVYVYQSDHVYRYRIPVRVTSFKKDGDYARLAGVLHIRLP